jgi:hypothetical protein
MLQNQDTRYPDAHIRLEVEMEIQNSIEVVGEEEEICS